MYVHCTRTVHGCTRTHMYMYKNVHFFHIFMYIYKYIYLYVVTFRFVYPNFSTKFRRNELNTAVAKRNFAEITFRDEIEKLYFGETIPTAGRKPDISAEVECARSHPNDNNR
jgi:hypothetical protein